MGERDHITFRADESLVVRLDDLAGRYEMPRSQLIRLLLNHAATTVEREGLDALVGSAGTDHAPADD